MSTAKTEGIVLKRRNLGEADRFVTLYTKHLGKIRVIAKGVRRPTSRKAGSLELFNQVEIVLAKVKDFFYFSEVEVMDSYSSWRKDLLAVGLACYLCELVEKLTAVEQKNQKIYQLLVEYLKKIDQLKPLILIRNFEEQLLEELGFGVPSQWRSVAGSLKVYIETVSEKEISSPRILKRLKNFT